MQGPVVQPATGCCPAAGGCRWPLQDASLVRETLPVTRWDSLPVLGAAGSPSRRHAEEQGRGLPRARSHKQGVALAAARQLL